MKNTARYLLRITCPRRTGLVATAHYVTADSDEDPMIRKAIEIIRTTKRASTSNLQRKLSIGYNRAARIMDELEDRGVVSADIPGQGREILLDL